MVDSRFEQFSVLADSSRKRYITQEITKMGKGNITAKIFNYRELCTATKNFNPDDQLGEGGFGRVYKGHIENPNQVPSENLIISLFLYIEKKEVLTNKYVVCMIFS